MEVRTSPCANAGGMHFTGTLQGIRQSQIWRWPTWSRLLPGLQGGWGTCLGKRSYSHFARNPSSSYLGLQGAPLEAGSWIWWRFFVNNRKRSKSRGERSLAGTRKKGRSTIINLTELIRKHSGFINYARCSIYTFSNSYHNIDNEGTFTVTV